MPPRKQYKKRSAPSKPTMKKAKAMVGKQHKSKAKKNMDTFFLKAKVQTTLIPAQGVTVANYIYEHFPILEQGSSFDVTGIPEFNLYRVQYDKVRINSVTVKITPKANVLDATLGQYDAGLNVSGDGMVHTAIDRDSSAPSNIARLERYPSYKAYSLLKGFTRTYSIKWPVSTWLDCSNIYGGDANTYLTRLGVRGGVTIYAENLPEDNSEIDNEPWCKVEVSYNCVFQGKTSAGLSVDQDGRVILTPETLVTNLPHSIRGVGSLGNFQPSGGVVSVDNSGNIVTKTDIE